MCRRIPWRQQAPREVKRRFHIEASGERVCLVGRRRLDDQGISQTHRVERLPEPTRRQRTRVGDILDPEHDEIHIPMQCEVLKAVVEQVHCGPKLRFGPADRRDTGSR